MKYEFILRFIEINFKTFYRVLGGKKENIDELFIENNRDSLRGKSFIASCSKSVFLFYSVVTFVLGLLLLILFGSLGLGVLAFNLYWFVIIYPLAMTVLSYVKEYKASHLVDKNIAFNAGEVTYVYDMVNIDLVVSLACTILVLFVISLYR